MEPQPPADIEDCYIAEFNARRKYAPESVISFTDFGVPELTEGAVRKMIKDGKVILSKFDNIKLCAMGHLIRKIHSSVTHNTQIFNLTRTVLTMKDNNADEFSKRMDMMNKLIETIVEEQVNNTCSDEPEEPSVPNVSKAQKEPKAQKALTVILAPVVGNIIIKKQSIPKKVKDDVWNTYIGEGIAKHKCLCCKKVTIDKTRFDCGHVISEKNGGTLEISNLRPICSACNGSMRSENMIEFIKMYGYYIG